MAKLLLWILLACVTNAAFAERFVLNNQQDVYPLGIHFRWHWDKTTQQPLDDILNERGVDWHYASEDVPNLGYSQHAVWFHLRLDNKSQHPHWFLHIDYPLIRDLDVYFVDENGEVDSVHTGDRFEFSARPLQHRNFIFPMNLSNQKSVDVYIRIHGPYAIQLPITLYGEQALVEQDVTATFLHGLFFGFVLLMACYNFFLFASTREAAYLYYVLFTLSIGGLQLVQQGFAFQFLWPNEVWLQNKATGAFVQLSLISSFLFVSSFLDLKNQLPLLYRSHFVIALISVFLLLVMPWMDELWVMQLGVALSLPSTFIAIFGGLFMWRKGRNNARLFLIAWCIFLVGVFLLALNKLGVVPRTFFTEHGAEIGTVVELALLAFALAGRINHERDRRIALERHARELESRALASKERALELEKLNSEQLERSVRERTRDLHKALSDLSLMNRQLEQLNLRDSVTAVGNENCFLSTLQKEWDRAFRRSESIALIVVELDGYREILSGYGEVVADECLKNVAGILERLISRPSDCITRYGDKVFGVILPSTDEKGATHLARQVIHGVSEREFDFGAVSVKATVSIGMACVQPKRPNNHKDLIEMAESAVYIARDNGGNCVQAAAVNPLLN